MEQCTAGMACSGFFVNPKPQKAGSERQSTPVEGCKRVIKVLLKIMGDCLGLLRRSTEEMYAYCSDLEES